MFAKNAAGTVTRKQVELCGNVQAGLFGRPNERTPHQPVQFRAVLHFGDVAGEFRTATGRTRHGEWGRDYPLTGFFLAPRFNGGQCGSVKCCSSASRTNSLMSRRSSNERVRSSSCQVVGMRRVMECISIFSGSLIPYRYHNAIPVERLRDNVNLW